MLQGQPGQSMHTLKRHFDDSLTGDGEPASDMATASKRAALLDDLSPRSNRAQVGIAQGPVSQGPVDMEAQPHADQHAMLQLQGAADTSNMESGFALSDSSREGAGGRGQFGGAAGTMGLDSASAKLHFMRQHRNELLAAQQGDSQEFGKLMQLWFDQNDSTLGASVASDLSALGDVNSADELELDGVLDVLEKWEQGEPDCKCM